MLDGTLYLVGINFKDGTYVENASPCALCKRMIINAGLKQVIVRDSKEHFRVIDVQSLIDNDESLTEFNMLTYLYFIYIVLLYLIFINNKYAGVI